MDNKFKVADNDFYWKIDVPIFGTSLVRKQLFIALGLPIILILIIVGFASGGEIFSSDFKYFIYVLVALAILTYLLTKLIYKGVFKAEFTVNDEGVIYKTQSDQKKKSKTVAFLVMFLSIFAKSPGAGAAGYVSQTNLENSLRWNQINDVSYHDKDKIIYLKASLMDKIAIFCTNDNYENVKSFIMEKVNS
jgi:hypothetical protein